MDKVARRLELLKLEGLGFSQSEIVKELSVKSACSKRTIYDDFETRASWQPTLQSVAKPEAILLKVVNRYEQIYRRAGFEHLGATEESSKIGALKVMLQANSLLLEAAVLPELLTRLKTLEEKARQGVFVP